MNEQYLINGLLNRNKVIFDFVFHFYYSGLCAYCERITNSRQVAEDIVQDLFVTLWIKHHQIRIESSLKNYLFTSVKNRSLDHLRHEERKFRKLENLAIKKELPENLATLWFAESELQAIVQKSLEKLQAQFNFLWSILISSIYFSDSVKKKLNVNHTSLSGPESFQFSIKRFSRCISAAVIKKV